MLGATALWTATLFHTIVSALNKTDIVARLLFKNPERLIHYSIFILRSTIFIFPHFDSLNSS